MIQDIYPHKFHVEYKNEQPENGDRILVFSNNQLLIHNQKTIDFLTYGEFVTQMEQYNLKCDDNTIKLRQNITYLFSMDDAKYYYLNVEDSVIKNFCDKKYKLVLRKDFRILEPKHFAFVAATAFQLDGWYTHNHFCGRCACPMEHDEKERMLRCPKCGNMVFPRINPAVIVAVTNKNKILLTKYRGREYTNYALVAGFVEIGESFEDTVRREVMEEAGLKVKNIRYYASQPWAFADDILAGYICEVEGDGKIAMDDEELSVAKFVDREDVPDVSPDISLTNAMIYAFQQGEF